jgi:hypothetical protein
VYGLTCFSTLYLVAVGTHLFFILDLLWFVWFRWFWDLTCDFWAENGKRKMAARVKVIDSVVLALAATISYGVEILVGKGLRDGGWLSASGFFPFDKLRVRMTAEARLWIVFLPRCKKQDRA